MIKLQDYKVQNTGRVIDITISKRIITEDGVRRIQQDLSFHDTDAGFKKVLEVLEDTKYWFVN